MKKLSVIIIFLAMALFALAACTGLNATTGDVSTDATDGSRITESAATTASPAAVPDDTTTATPATDAAPSPTSSAAATATATTTSTAAPETTAAPTSAPAATPTATSTTTDNGTFRITTTNGKYTSSGNVYTITAAGDYTISGQLTGRLVISAPDTADVTITMNGVTITCSDSAPIQALSADSLKIIVAAGTKNYIYDKRATKISDDDDQGAGAITAKCDLSFSSTGSLTVDAGYNNGIHTTKDLKIADVTLSVTAPNNALKGKNSVTIDSGTLTVISTDGDGIKTTDSNLSSTKGKQQGTVTFNGGSTTVYAAGDGIQSAYDFVMNGGTLTIYNGENSTYTAKNSSVDSYKGIKVKNILTVNSGTLIISSQDDGLHADYGDTLENGSKGQGSIFIKGGSVAITTSTTTAISGGGFGGGPGGGGPGGGGPGGGGPGGGWGGFGGGGFGGMGFGQGGGGADAIHADNTLSISGGTVVVSTSYEGLEANIVVISGGNITIAASDDGINASKKIGMTPSVTISGGTVDITMGSGDTDGIDSNGSFSMTGGLVIVRGAPNSTNGMATGLDCDGTAKLTGGTFIQLGPRETTPTLGSGCYTLNFGSSGGRGGRPGGGGPGGWGGGSDQGTTGSYSFGSGTWTLSGLNISFTVADGCTYSGAVVYSSQLTKGASYTMTNGSTTYTVQAQ